MLSSFLPNTPLYYDITNIVPAQISILPGLQRFNNEFDGLTHWGPNKMVAISHTFSNAFFCVKMGEFCLRFHWSLFLRFELTILQHWFRSSPGANQATSHCLKPRRIFTVHCLKWISLRNVNTQWITTKYTQVACIHPNPTQPYFYSKTLLKKIYSALYPTSDQDLFWIKSKAYHSIPHSVLRHDSCLRSVQIAFINDKH